MDNQRLAEYKMLQEQTPKNIPKEQKVALNQIKNWMFNYLKSD